MFWHQKTLYMDAAASTPLSREVKACMEAGFDVYGNPGALHREGQRALEALEAARREAAEAIGAHADEIIFTGSGTEANNLAVMGALSEVAGAHAITTAIEHPSVLEPLRLLERRGVSVTYLAVEETGLLAPRAVQDAIRENTTLVSIGLINSEVGVVADVRATAKAVRHARKMRENARPLLFHIDASQAPLWMPLKVDALGCDLMTLDAQKMMGPKGIGLLYVRRGTTLAPHILGGGQEGGLRSGTPSPFLASACARALSLAQRDCEENSTRIARVRDILLEEIEKIIPDAKVNGDIARRVANNLNISIRDMMGERAVLALSQWGVMISTRSACAAKDEELSHVIRAMYGGEEGSARARSAVRFTLLPSAGLGDVKKAAQLLCKAAARYRNIDMTLK